MATTAVNPVQDRERKPSALENAAKILGIVSSVGQLGFKGYDVFNKVTAPKPGSVDFSKPVMDSSLNKKNLDTTYTNMFSENA